jgi:hypothetical protein
VARAPHSRGTGAVSTVAGVAAFLLFLLFAVQLLVNLYAASAVTAAGFDAARTVASRHVDHGDPASVLAAQQVADGRFRSLLGRSADTAELRWSVDQERVRLHVRVEAPAVLPTSLGHRVAFGRIERTFEVRVEALT